MACIAAACGIGCWGVGTILTSGMSKCLIERELETAAHLSPLFRAKPRTDLPDYPVKYDEGCHSCYADLFGSAKYHPTLRAHVGVTEIHHKYSVQNG